MCPRRGRKGSDDRGLHTAAISVAVGATTGRLHITGRCVRASQQATRARGRTGSCLARAHESRERRACAVPVSGRCAYVNQCVSSIVHRRPPLSPYVSRDGFRLYISKRTAETQLPSPNAAAAQGAAREWEPHKTREARHKSGYTTVYDGAICCCVVRRRRCASPEQRSGLRWRAVALQLPYTLGVHRATRTKATAEDVIPKPYHTAHTSHLCHIYRICKSVQERVP